MNSGRVLIITVCIALAWALSHCTNAWAADNQGGLRGGLIIGSTHWDNENWNEDQEGLYVCYRAVCAGEYKNSYSDIDGNGEVKSRFLMYEYYIGSAVGVDFTAAVGVVDGYKGYGSSNEWQPYGGLSARIAIFKLWQLGRATAYGIEIPVGGKE